MSDKVLSIIIPVYNLQMCVEETVNSIYEQKVANNLFETIIIDDASWDGTGIVLDRLESQYNNLTVIHSKHVGVSAVRNIGINKSAADYIMFLDGDDLLSQGSLLCFINEIIQSQVDCIVGRSYLLGATHELYPWNKLFLTETSYKGMEVLESDYIRGSIWGLAVRRQFLFEKNIFFLEGARNGEDSMFFLTMCLNEPTIIFKDIAILEKRPRKGSASLHWSLSRVIHYKLCIDYLAAQKKVYCSPLEVKHIDRMLYIMISMVVNGFTIKGYFCPLRIKKILDLNQILPLRVSTGIICKWKMRLLNRSVVIYVLLNWMINRIRC